MANSCRIVRLYINRADPNFGRVLWHQTSFVVFEHLRRVQGPFELLSGYRQTTASVSSGAAARQIRMVFADHDYLALLGVLPQHGRVFRADENQPPSGTPVAVLSDRYWRAVHGGDEGVIGETISISGTGYTVIGVMPQGSQGDATEPVDVWPRFVLAGANFQTGGTPATGPHCAVSRCSRGCRWGRRGAQRPSRRPPPIPRDAVHRRRRGVHWAPVG